MINGVKMPAHEVDFNITIGWFEPPRVVEVIPEPKNLPRVNINNFLMNGKMTITLSRALNFPEKIHESMDLRMLPGDVTDPSVLGFNYTITS